MSDVLLLSGVHVHTSNHTYGPYSTMISLKTFHYLFITLSILLTAYYGVFEITQPTTPGLTSDLVAVASFLVSGGLIYYGMNVHKKFKQI